MLLARAAVALPRGFDATAVPVLNLFGAFVFGIVGALTCPGLDP